MGMMSGSRLERGAVTRHRGTQTIVEMDDRFSKPIVLFDQTEMTGGFQLEQLRSRNRPVHQAAHLRHEDAIRVRCEHQRGRRQRTECRGLVELKRRQMDRVRSVPYGRTRAAGRATLTPTERRSRRWRRRRSRRLRKRPASKSLRRKNANLQATGAAERPLQFLPGVMANSFPGSCCGSLPIEQDTSFGPWTRSRRLTPFR